MANDLVGGRQFNIASNRQIGDILIDEWKAPPTRRLKTGWSMNADSLDRMRNTAGLDDRIYQLIDAVLRFRELSKLKSTYADALPKMVNPDTGRVHSTFNQAGSATGRLASNDPNVQNIPVRTALGREIRNAFSTRYSDGWQLISADYSQIELRILAHMSREPGLLKAFRDGEDIHNATASAMYGDHDVTSEQRRIAKILNFGVIYGLGPQGVARQTDLSVKQGREFIDLYFGKYPGIRDFIDHQKQVAKMRGIRRNAKGSTALPAGLTIGESGSPSGRRTSRGQHADPRHGCRRDQNRDDQHRRRTAPQKHGLPNDRASPRRADI